MTTTTNRLESIIKKRLSKLEKEIEEYRHSELRSVHLDEYDHDKRVKRDLLKSILQEFTK